MPEVFKEIDLGVLDLVRGADLDRLRDAQWLERDLLPRLGLNNEKLHQFPPELHPFAGRGLHYWQYPNQFAPYLATLAGLGIGSYLEIGVRHAGTFVLTVEYLRRFRPGLTALGVDIGESPSLRRYRKQNPRASFLCVDSLSAEFTRLIGQHPGFDLALIDGNHEEYGVKSDLALVAPKARHLALHDIVNQDTPGVVATWREMRAGLGEHFCFHEFIAQYPSLAASDQSFLGIGLAERKAQAA
jgi:hypothetical protein